MFQIIQIINIIAPLFIIIFVSAILRKLNYIHDYWSKVLNEFAVKIGLPILLFSALAKTSFSFKAEFPLILANSVVVLTGFIMIIALNKIFKFTKQTFLTLFFCLTFGNIAYLGIPVITQVYGENTLSQISLLIAIYFFWIFTVGVGYLDYANNSNGERHIIKHLFINLFKKPLIIAIIFGIIFGILNIEIPLILNKPLNMISTSVTPIVLLVIGIFIGSSKFGKLSEWFFIFLFSIVTLILLPAIFYFSLKIFGFSPSNFSISIIELAMPFAITPFALADEYNLNKKFIAHSIVLSTILSILTLPFWMSIL
ncbi:MAG: AEC family transporter [Candidatus Moranbacteria bacterium]|nr:AEC family transporter [Candidatus Moranbacteria bacterium]